MDQHRNIALIGLMGSGKTTIGKLLSKKLNMNFIDSDSYIEQRQQQSINQIFSDHGEDYFRKLESEFCESLKSSTNTVISTGGGIVLDSNNRRNLRKYSTVCWLSIKPQNILRRISSLDSRPLLNVDNPEDVLNKIYESRFEYYKQTAHITLDVTYGSKFEILSRLMKMIR